MQIITEYLYEVPVILKHIGCATLLKIADRSKLQFSGLIRKFKKDESF